MTTTSSLALSRDQLDFQREFKFKLFDRGLATISALGLICSGLFGLASYANQGKADRELKRREIQLTIYRVKKEVYYPLCESASAIVSSGSAHEARKDIKKYMTLYYGKAHLVVIDPAVHDAKIAFKKRLLEWVKQEGNSPPPEDLIALALKLTGACQTYLDPRTVLGS